MDVYIGTYTYFTFTVVVVRTTNQTRTVSITYYHIHVSREHNVFKLDFFSSTVYLVLTVVIVS